MRKKWFRVFNPLVLIIPVLFGLTACMDDITPPEQDFGEAFGVVLNSTGRSLTAFPADSPSASFSIGLADDGTPVSMAVLGNRAVVPLGTYPFAAVVDLAKRTVEHTVPLPEGSGATGTAFISESVALVANPGLNTVSPVNIGDGTAGEQIPVGRYPQAIVYASGYAFVLNSELDENYAPDGPGTISVIETQSLTVVDSIQLSGYNPSAVAVSTDGMLYVVNSGSYGQGNGSLSIVNPVTREEIGHFDGFGDFPGSVAFGLDGRLYVGSYAYGISVWDPAGRTFIRSPSDPVQPGESPSVSALAIDFDGRLNAAKPGNCTDPSTVLRLGSDYGVEQTIDVGVCPVDITFTLLREE